MSHTDPTKKHDALLVFEAVDSNPNGDPDNAGRPRVDLDTGHGLVSDVSLKRKVRDSVLLRVAEEELPGESYGIFIRRGVSLNEQLDAVAAEVAPAPKNKKDTTAADVLTRQREMQRRYFDVRTFGAVMSTGTAPAGKLTGPVTVGIARSIDPVAELDLGITRTASTHEDKKDNQSQMGSKTVVPYGVYTARIHYQPTKDNAVSEQDLDVLWTCLMTMFEVTRSAARPDITVRGLHVFTHESRFGNAPARNLLDRVKISLREGVEHPRSWQDYRMDLSGLDELPQGVRHVELSGAE